MSKGNQAQGTQATQGDGPQTIERQAEDKLEAVRKDLTELRGLLLDMAVSQLKSANAFAQCRACTKVATRYFRAQHIHFGIQEVPLCDDHELSEGWRDTGSKREQTDPNLLEIIRITNRLKQVERR